MNSMDDASSVPDQLRALTRQISSVEQRDRGNETGLQQTLRQQIGQPFRSGDIRLAPGHSLDMLGVDEQQFTAPFQDIPNRFPIFAVLSMATWVHSPRASQSESRQSSAVVVPKVSVVLVLFPRSSRLKRHSATVSWCTSSPAQDG